MKKQLIKNEVDRIIAELQETQKLYWRCGDSAMVRKYDVRIAKYQKIKSELNETDGKTEST